jgi:hypothetical protein
MAAAALAVTTVIAACGSNSPTSPSASGSAGQPGQAQVQQAQQAAVRFAGCLRSHGVHNFPDPTSPRDLKTSFAGIKSPAVDAAATACRHLLGSRGSPGPTAAQRQAQTVAALAFARCLRGHGFPQFPDPSSSGELTHQMLAAAGIDIHQPAVVQAADACVGVTHGLITRAGVARFVAGR